VIDRSCAVCLLCLA